MKIRLTLKKKIIFSLLLVPLGFALYVYGAPLPKINEAHFKKNMYTKNTENTMTLSDRRILGYAVYGNPNGFPVFYFHGGQESRLSSGFMDSMAIKLNIKLVAPDRPGIGLSTYHENRQLLDYASDIRELADYLKFEKFSIFGLSGGGPHVLACAYSMPDRIEKVTIVSGTGPNNYKGKLKGMWFPVKLVHWFAASKKDNNLRGFIAKDCKTILEKPKKRLRQLQRFLPKPDRRLLRQNPEYGIDFIKGSQEAYKQGIEAVVQEWKLYVSDWGFKLDDIKLPITLWYGTKDKMTPKYRGFYLHEKLQESKLHVLENEGHFSLIRNHQTEILKGLLTEN